MKIEVKLPEELRGEEWRERLERIIQHETEKLEGAVRAARRDSGGELRGDICEALAEALGSDPGKAKTRLIKALRARGWSMGEIGEVVGMTRQGVGYHLGR